MAVFISMRTQHNNLGTEVAMQKAQAHLILGKLLSQNKIDAQQKINFCY